MEDTIRQIISLDNETEAMKIRYREIIDGKDEELRLKLQELERNSTDECKEEIKKIQERIHNTSDKYSNDITPDLKDNIEILAKRYEEMKETIINDLWGQMFLGYE